jgi:hypothetical protein
MINACRNRTLNFVWADAGVLTSRQDVEIPLHSLRLLPSPPRSLRSCFARGLASYIPVLALAGILTLSQTAETAALTQRLHATICPHIGTKEITSMHLCII